MRQRQWHIGQVGEQKPRVDEVELLVVARRLHHVDDPEIHVGHSRVSRLPPGHLELGTVHIGSDHEAVRRQPGQRHSYVASAASQVEATGPRSNP